MAILDNTIVNGNLVVNGNTNLVKIKEFTSYSSDVADFLDNNYHKVLGIQIITSSSITSSSTVYQMNIKTSGAITTQTMNDKILGSDTNHFLKFMGRQGNYYNFALIQNNSIITLRCTRGSSNHILMKYEIGCCLTNDECYIAGERKRNQALASTPVSIYYIG